MINTIHIDYCDSVCKRLLDMGADLMGEPKTHPQDARSFQLRDPDGNILHFRSQPKGN